MQDFRGKVVVVTGAGSGIGRALARHAATEGMRLVIADVEKTALANVERELRDAGAQVIAVRTDVSKASHIRRLAERTLKTYGAVHVLFNNAGVGVGTTAWEGSGNDWEWVLGVNLWGTVHGVRAFVPIMLEQGGECHIVNTASFLGLVTMPWLGIYSAAKSAVVAYTEALYYELMHHQPNIKVSLLCPGFTNTKLVEGNRNRPATLQNRHAVRPPDQTEAAFKALWEQAVLQGTPPEEVAAETFAAIREGRFYVLTHPDLDNLIETRHQDIRLRRNPTDEALRNFMLNRGMARDGDEK